ncbi:HEAT repeat domain-containing protein [Microseira sp. BLCC-F43]|jgi:HEAT repeat protein/energy-coupling factor transporter ATP-binding protein EcfA2|uniref:HEAT repeat domain-containing protein n=1 Tax=Microseira sp. BLCC-F43 TaxID=3153602 RepID=UPI0035B97E07
MARSIRVASECIARVKHALRCHGFPSQNALAVALGLSRSTITSFFTGKPVDYVNFVEISERLGLDWQAIAYIDSPPLETTPPPETNNIFDWKQASKAMLLAQERGRLTTNPLTAGDGLTFELDDIYVPLGLVERQQRQRRIGDISPQQGSKFYDPDTADEIIQTFDRQDRFFDQVIKSGKSQRIAIIGEPGSGKTTLLQKIASWIIENTSDVPIWISLADLQGKSIEEYLLSNWLRSATRKVRVTPAMEEALGELFNSGKVWLLLDAVDEMAIGATTGLPLQTIANQLTGWIADARVVLTCRLNVWDGGKNALETFETYRNLDFSYGNLDGVGQFIRRWFKDNLEVGDRLRLELDQPGRERIFDAVKNPLRLALLCRTWTLAPDGLPNTKAALYRHFIEALYEWKQERFPTSSRQRQQLNQALGELALKAIAEEKTKFRLRHRLVTSVLGEPDEDLFKLALQLGFLNQVGVAAETENWGEKVYAFYHPTFQEYFAAQAINDWHYFLNSSAANYRIFEPQWQEVILLWLGREDILKEQKEEFIQALVEFEDGLGEFSIDGYQYKGFYEYRAYFIAAEAIAEFADCSKADEIVAQIVQWRFGYFNSEKQKWINLIPTLKESIRLALIKTDRSRAIASLLHLLKSGEDESIRWRAAYNLGTIGIGNKDAIAAIVNLIKISKNEASSSQAAWILGKIDPGNQDAIATLLHLIKSTETESIRRLAACYLGKINPGNETAVTTLIQLVDTSLNSSIRRQAIESLGEIATGNKPAIASLLQQIVNSTETDSIRQLAAESLGKIAQGDRDCIAVLTSLITTTEKESIRRIAATALGTIDAGNKDAIATLTQLTESAKTESSRRRAAFNLVRIAPGNKAAIAALLQIIKSTKKEAPLRKCVESLGEISIVNKTEIDAIIKLVESSQLESIRRQAALSLGKIAPGNRLAIAELLQLIQTTKNPSILWQAAESLKQILPDEQLPEVVSSLKQYLSQETYKNNIDRYRECYNIIGYCAQNMNYPEFYQAWTRNRVSV